MLNHSLHPLLNESLEIKSMKLGLERVEQVDRALGFPSRQFAAVHVGGTNGKGSVCTKIAKALQANGKKVGLYTSPHVTSYRERIQVNGKYIPEEDADRLLKKITATADLSLSFFELLTLLAFCYFAEQRVDFAVIEVGIGGRLDATNIVKPVLAVITSVDLDHMQHLGKTLEQIAYEKAGIIKPGVPTVLGPHAKPHEVFEKSAALTRSPLFDVRGSFAHFEQENRAIASVALSLLPFPLEKRSIEEGLAALPPCRFEQVEGSDPLIILDVAHNPDGIRRLIERLSYTFPGKEVCALAGFSADKDTQATLSQLEKGVEKLFLTHSDHPRLKKLGEPFDQAFEKALDWAKQHDQILVVCGSFFIMDAAKRAVSKRGWGREDG